MCGREGAGKKHQVEEKVAEKHGGGVKKFRKVSKGKRRLTKFGVRREVTITERSTKEQSRKPKEQ